MELIITILVVFGGIFWMLLSPGIQRGKEQSQKMRLREARIKMAEARTAQLPEQTEGIIRRYLMTTENTENAVIRQEKQQIEILKLRLQVLALQRELGQEPGTGFTATDYK